MTGKDYAVESTESRSKSLDEWIELFHRQKDGLFLKGNYTLRYLKDLIYNKFFRELSEIIYDKFGDMISLMSFDVFWTYDDESPDDDLNSKNNSFSLVYIDDWFNIDYEEHEPLIKFVFDLDEDKLTTAGMEKMFAQIESKIETCLSKAYYLWTESLARYYKQLHEEPRRCRTIVVELNPLDNPERYFLSHEVVKLD